MYQILPLWSIESKLLVCLMSARLRSGKCDDPSRLACFDADEVLPKISLRLVYIAFLLHFAYSELAHSTALSVPIFPARPRLRAV